MEKSWRDRNEFTGGLFISRKQMKRLTISCHSEVSTAFHGRREKFESAYSYLNTRTFNRQATANTTIVS